MQNFKQFLSSLQILPKEAICDGEKAWKVSRVHVYWFGPYTLVVILKWVLWVNKNTGISVHHLVKHKQINKSKRCIEMSIVDSADQDCGLWRKVCLWPQSRFILLTTDWIFFSCVWDITGELPWCVWNGYWDWSVFLENFWFWLLADISGFVIRHMPLAL